MDFGGNVIALIIIALFVVFGAPNLLKNKGGKGGSNGNSSSSSSSSEE